MFLHGSTESGSVWHPLEFTPLVMAAGWLLPLFPDATWSVVDGDPWAADRDEAA